VSVLFLLKNRHRRVHRPPALRDRRLPGATAYRGTPMHTTLHTTWA